ncbi:MULTISPECIES: hypothetical protein [unclassified Pseudomonas]|nr:MULTISPECIES: hypothetical protein [unclassified Pseudomonas]MCU1738501.1 hypothetical protein [Pseudomonas sp. 20S_6.2_Bac1]
MSSTDKTDAKRMVPEFLTWAPPIKNKAVWLSLKVCPEPMTDQVLP